MSEQNPKHDEGGKGDAGESGDEEAEGNERSDGRVQAKTIMLYWLRNRPARK